MLDFDPFNVHVKIRDIRYITAMRLTDRYVVSLGPSGVCYHCFTLCLVISFYQKSLSEVVN